MSLASRVNDLATGIGAYLKNTILPRVLPAGGTAGQVLTKNSAANYDAAWAAAAGGGGGYSRTILGADVQASATANAIGDITGLSFPVAAGQRYFFEFFIIYTAAALTTGSRFSINGPAASEIVYDSDVPLTATTQTSNRGLGAYNLPAASNASSPVVAPAKQVARVSGFIVPTAAGTVIARFASEIAASAIIAKAGSFVRYQAV